MESWRQYAFSIIVCSFVCGIISHLFADSKRKALMQLVSGTVIAITVLHPLSAISLDVLLPVSVPEHDSAEAYITEGEHAALEARMQCITASCETYILEKAKLLGADLDVRISLNPDFIPTMVEISGDADPGVQKQLQTILATDLGIPKENQKWVKNQESNSS